MNWLSEFFGFFRAFQFWVIVAPWELGLRVRLGNRAQVLRPGPHWRIPFLDRIFVQSVRLRAISDSGQTVTTRDGKILTLAVAVTYHIEDIEKLYNSVSSPESTLLHQIQGIIANEVSTHDASGMTPASLESLITEKLPCTEWGLGSVRLMITTFAFIRAFRIMQYDYRSLSAANELEPSESRRP